MSDIHEYTREACPICEQKGWCGRREDGLVLCKRSPSPPGVPGYTFRGMAKDGHTGMYVENGREFRPKIETIPRTSKPTSAKSKDEKSRAQDPSPETTLELHAAAFTSQRRSLLSQELGLPECAFNKLAIGWSETAGHHDDHTVVGAWVFAECDGQGRIIGASYRFPQDVIAGKAGADGSALGGKSAPAGCHRGLTLPTDWREMPEPVLVAEGASDVLAGRAVGLSVIGRPSNTGGAEHIAQALRSRRAIVLGENDRKGDGRWPGKEGAESVSRKLEAAWGRPVPVAFPPDGTKDLRDWIGQLVLDWPADLSSVRGSIFDSTKPPELLLLAKPQKRGRPVVEAFAWSAGPEVPAFYSDRIDTKDASARRRFVKEVQRIKPDVDVADLTHRLLTLEIPTSGERGTTSPATDNSPVCASQTGGNQLPAVFLPGGPTTILESAQKLGDLLARTGEYFIRGGSVVTVGCDDEGLPILEALRPTSLASAFETVCKLKTYIRSGNNFLATDTVCREQDARLIQDSSAFRQALPHIRILSRCPVLVERDGELIQICGYDRDSGILAFGDPVDEVELAEAVALLQGMLAGFRFATASDKARALAAVITPALVFGALLNGRAPVDLGEADQSQAGKGYRNKLTASIYCCRVKTVTQKKGGVGSLEESFASALIRGYNFISFDNVRGLIDSPTIESFLTEDTFFARGPYMSSVEVNPRRVIVLLTSNKAEITTDLANRSACVSILKQPDGYHFDDFPEGDILDHVRANQPLYLGAVFAVLKAWHQASKPQTTETRHDFRPWARTLDWIVQNIFNAGELLDGHRQMQDRVAMPVLNWLRDVALAVRQAVRLDITLRASDVLEIISENPLVEVPGLTEGADISEESVRKHVLQAMGRKLALCFKSSDVVTIGDMRIERAAEHDESLRRDIRTYRFTGAAAAPMETGSAPMGASDETANAPICSYCVRHFSNCGHDIKSCTEMQKPGMRQSDMAQMSETSNAIGADRCIGRFVRFRAGAPIGAIGANGPSGASGPFERFELRAKAEALVKGRRDAEELLHIFDEREAIAFVDGGLDDKAAGQVAYEHVQRELLERDST